MLTYHSSFFTLPNNEAGKAVIEGLGKAPYVWAGFVSRENSTYTLSDLLGLENVQGTSHEYPLKGGAYFQFLVIRGARIPEVLKVMENMGDKAIGLLGFCKAETWSTFSVLNMRPEKIDEMAPALIGRHLPVHRYPNDVTIGSSWKDAVVNVGNRINVWRQALRSKYGPGLKPPVAGG